MGSLESMCATSRFFTPGVPVLTARAPGRLDVLGGIADYSGATVLEIPLALSVRAVLQGTNDGMLAAWTSGAAVPRLTKPIVAVPTSVLFDGKAEDAPARLRAALDQLDARWATYVLGPLAMLVARKLVIACDGLRVAVRSDVPAGAGISSSAALEVASLRVFDAYFQTNLDPLSMALIAQSAEHQVAGAPCGIMDQATAVLGRAGHLLMLRCQPVEVLGQRALPRDVQVLGIDSGVAHRVSGTQYGLVRTATFMGRAIIAANGPGQPPGGYLCNITPAEFEDRYQALLPIEMRGADFIARYGATGDDATTVDSSTMYPVRACATHPVIEQDNVEQFLAALDRYETGGALDALSAAGQAMLRSHASYGTRCGLGTPETDLIVKLLLDQEVRRGAIYGAKITGGGAGGTVAVLGTGDGFPAAAAAVASRYADLTGHTARIIAGSGEGAAAQPVSRSIWNEEGTDNGL
jgi:L-arabinokinase